MPELHNKITSELGIKKQKLEKIQRVSIKGLLMILVVILAIVFIATQHKDFENSIQAIKDADIRMVSLSFFFSVTTYLAASMVYKLISIQPIPYFRTLLVQVTSSFTNRLLPAGTGGLATFGRYLVKQGHTKPQAVALATVNNLLGFMGLASLTLIVAFASQTPLDQAIRIAIPSWVYLLVLGAVLLAVTVLAIVPKLREFVRKTIKNIVRDFKTIAANPLNLVLALLFSMLITASYAGVLYFAIQALGQEATILQTFIVLTTGVAAASVTPTPGGVGGAEAGLVAGLGSIGISADVGLSIALVYRMATFWLPIIPGFIAFQFAVKREVL